MMGSGPISISCLYLSRKPSTCPCKGKLGYGDDDDDDDDNGADGDDHDDDG
jgi:hypothetical protein